MGIFRTNNPLEFADVDGIIIDEKAPSPQVQGVGTGVAILVGIFQRGESALRSISGTQDFYEKYGKSSLSGNVALRNKKFSAGMKLVRVVASDAAAAQIVADDGVATDILQFDALYKGSYGNNLSVLIEAGSDSGKKITLSDGNDDSVLEDEVYDNYLVADGAAPFANSQLMSVSVLATSAEPALAVVTNLASGSDGTVADTDYEDAIKLCEGEGSGNILFLDSYNAVRNAYLKTHAGLTQDKLVIVAGGESDSVAETTADAALNRDVDGRIIYVANWVKTLIDGVATFTSPASWMSSILSQTSPTVDPAYFENAQLMFGALELKNNYTRADYIAMMAAGVCAFENDEGNIKPKSGVVTQIANSSKLTILRRRMADYLTVSMARFLKVYQNDVNSEEKRTDVKGSLLSFIRSQELLGILPKDSEVSGGSAKLVDIESLNTNESIALGKFFIQYKQRIYSSMRFIVLRAEIGESVVVTEGE